MAGLVPAIHVFPAVSLVDARPKAGHDPEFVRDASCLLRRRERQALANVGDHFAFEHLLHQVE